ncbi:hypothetical protein IWT140_01258 [Secundilactobacillus pentosiphilus]|uniref:Uncharacterized protein n=1 Tax=Secundilactobacillus pentosiphilus TaxID=1714682 RepID=A0A1Z5IPG3_9LACO|nr:hypothetical protein IWT140_01258 [Secundilactobacillus pentosiphilus]
MEVGIKSSDDSDIQITHIISFLSANEVQFLIEPTDPGRVTHTFY